jgi:hypothetical protein
MYIYNIDSKPISTTFRRGWRKTPLLIVSNEERLRVINETKEVS